MIHFHPEIYSPFSPLDGRCIEKNANSWPGVQEIVVRQNKFVQAILGLCPLLTEDGRISTWSG